MIETVEKFQSYSNDIKKYIKKSDYKMIHFVKKLNLTESTFYRKIKENSFTIKEIVILTRVLFPEEYYKHEFNRQLELSIQNESKGKLVNAKDHINDLRKKFL